jgi:hypothetical protein
MHNIKYYVHLIKNYNISIVCFFRPDEIAIHTLFLGKIPDGKIQSWIIALAIALGILILLFIVLALVKVRDHIKNN